MMQLLERGGFDPDGWIVGLGGEMAGTFNQDAKHDLAHAGGLTWRTVPSLCCLRGSGRAAAYGQPIRCTAAGPRDGRRVSARVRASNDSAMTPTREQILAASAGWVAVVLNIVPGLGTGYLYQRRWRAYWITSALATAWFVAGALLAREADATAEAQNQLVGLIGLLVLAAVTAGEAGQAVKRVRQSP